MLAVGCAAPSTSLAPAPGVNPNIALAPLHVQALDGGDLVLAKVLAGRPTLVTLWATWCESCAAEFDALRRLAPKAEAQGAYVVAIAEGEPYATVDDFVRARALTYPQLVDEPFALADSIGARRIPATLVIDRKGTIVFRGAALDRDALDALDHAIAAR